MSVVSVKFVNIFSEWRHATSNLSFRCTSSLIHISTKPNRFVYVNVMNLRSPRTTQLKTVHSAGAKNPAASLNVRLHHKTTKFRSNASVQSFFSMFHFVNFKTFLAIHILYHQIFSLLQHSVIHLCTSSCSSSILLNYVIKITNLGLGLKQSQFSNSTSAETENRSQTLLTAVTYMCTSSLCLWIPTNNVKAFGRWWGQCRHQPWQKLKQIWRWHFIACICCKINGFLF